MNTDIRCYAVRRLNPFQGVVEVVSRGAARALSIDGRHWEIQVLAERPDHTWHSLGASPGVSQFFRFGHWSADSGLRSVPANPLLDIGSMQRETEQLIEALQQLQDQLPFTLSDDYEFWLTDADGLPVALIATSPDPELMSAIHPERWHAALLQDRDFVSATLLERGVPQHDGHNPRRHPHELERLVASIATGPARWFHRQPDGTARPATPGEAGTVMLPELVLRETWTEPWQAALVDDYLDWLAPALLTLSHLAPATRARLEQAAARRAVALDQAFDLYPEVIDHALLDTARVEARLRRSGTTGQ